MQVPLRARRGRVLRRAAALLAISGPVLIGGAAPSYAADAPAGCDAMLAGNQVLVEIDPAATATGVEYAVDAQRSDLTYAFLGRTSSTSASFDQDFESGAWTVRIRAIDDEGRSARISCGEVVVGGGEQLAPVAAPDCRQPSAWQIASGRRLLGTVAVGEVNEGQTLDLEFRNVVFRVTDAAGQTVTQGVQTSNSSDGTTYRGKLKVKDIAPGTYTVQARVRVQDLPGLGLTGVKSGWVTCGTAVVPS